MWWDSLFAKLLRTFFIAMVPVIELRGAIPYGVALDLPLWTSIAVSVVGNLVPVPFILLFIRKIFAWMRRRIPKLNALVSSLEARAESKKATVLRYQFWGLVILVAIPLPGTGAWTGALVAALLDMRLRRAVPVIFAGVCIAAAIMTALTFGVIHFT